MRQVLFPLVVCSLAIAAGCNHGGADTGPLEAKIKKLESDNAALQEELKVLRPGSKTGKGEPSKKGPVDAVIAKLESENAALLAELNSLRAVPKMGPSGLAKKGPEKAEDTIIGVWAGDKVALARNPPRGAKEVEMQVLFEVMESLRLEFKKDGTMSFKMHDHGQLGVVIGDWKMAAPQGNTVTIDISEHRQKDADRGMLHLPNSWKITILDSDHIKIWEDTNDRNGPDMDLFFRCLDPMVEQAKTNLKWLNLALESYSANHSKYPERLADLRNPDDFGPGYIKEDMLKDPWGTAYTYELNTRHPGTGLPLIYSLGPPGQKQRITNWD